LRKVVSTIGNNKVEHPALVDINSNKREYCNMMQLTGKPIKNSAFFELKNYRYRNYVM